MSPLYNSRIIDTYLRLLQKSYPHVDVADLLDASGMKSYQTADPGHWFSQEQVDRFYNRLVELCRNPDIAREAGQFAASAEALGTFRQYILAMMGPSNVFALASKAASRLTRSAAYTSRRLGPRKVEVTVRPYPGVEEKEFQCANRLGWFEAAVRMFDCKMEKIEHPQCLFQGDDVCRYIISWTAVPATFWKKFRNMGILALPPLLAATVFFSSSISPLPLLLSTGLIASLLSLFAEMEDKIRLKNYVEHIRQETEKALNTISANHDNARLTEEVGRAISQETQVQSILDRVLELISQRMGFDRVMVFLTDSEHARLELRAAYGFAKEDRDILQNFPIPIDPSHRERLLPKVFWSREPVLVDNPDKMKSSFSDEGFNLIKHLNAESFLCCPIVCNGTSLGILAADKKTQNSPLRQTDLSLMDGVAAYIGIALRNADLLEDLESQLKQIREKDRELAIYRKNLEEQVKIRTIQLQDALRTAEAANNAKSEFLANMSHEIRTPMTVFMVAIDHLLYIDTDPERRRMLEMAEKSAERLRGLIDDILDLSRIEAGGVEIEQRDFDLHSCVHSAVALFALSAREKNLRLETEVASGVPERVLGDSDRLGQVLINLLGNALKFTPEGEIRVSVRPRGDLVEFAVADTGIGIPAEKQHLLFQSFSQTDNSFHRQYGGSGLGLAISKGLVELMGGQIDVLSRPGEGSVFTFTLPLSASAPLSFAPAETVLDLVRENSSARILYAEDDPMVQELIKTILVQGGWQAETAENGRVALERWMREGFDVILMDLQMPEMDGIEATREIRKRESEGGLKRTSIIGLTAHAGRDIKEKCLASGMDQVLTKPVQMKDLISAIEGCLRFKDASN